MKNLFCLVVASVMGAFAVFGNDLSPIVTSLEKQRMSMEADCAPLLAKEWKAHGISSADILVDSATYTGAGVTPSVVVKLNGSTLTNANYTLTYTSNTNAGWGCVTVTADAKGLYGSQLAKFRIEPIELAASNVTAISAQTYNGYPLTPTPAVTNGVSALVSGTDYIVEGYADNVEKGTGTVSVVGIGNFKGKVIVPFEIQ